MDREVSLPSEIDQAQPDSADQMHPGSPALQDSYSGGGADDDLEERIRQRAYEIYCSRNGGDGNAMEDWLAAERAVRFGGSAVEREGHGPSLIESLSEDAGEDAERDVAG